MIGEILENPIGYVVWNSYSNRILPYALHTDPSFAVGEEGLTIEPVFTLSQLQGYRDYFIRDTLETVMLICETVAEDYEEKEQFLYPELRSDAVQGCESCYHAIHELRERVSK